MAFQFWFDFASTYSYLAAMHIESVALSYGVDVEWNAFLLGPVFKPRAGTILRSISTRQRVIICGVTWSGFAIHFQFRFDGRRCFHEMGFLPPELQPASKVRAGFQISFAPS